METFKFILPTGIEAEVTALYGKHQEILTRQGNKGENPLERSNQLLLSIVKRVGTVSVITEDFLNKMLSCDRRACLAAARQFTFDFEELFYFRYGYKVGADKRQHEEPVELPSGGMFPFKPTKQQVSDYAQLFTEVDVVLPKSGQTVRFNLMDGIGEKMGGGMKRKDINSSSLLALRRPRYFYRKNEDAEGAYIGLNLSNLHLRDIEYLREQVHEHEGQLYADIQFENPRLGLADFDEEKESRIIIIDLVNSPEFFFPSALIG